jgi:HlyD family secretion protein
MQVLVQVNEADIGNVRPGQDVTFAVDAFPTQTFRGQVRKVRLNATMTQNVVTYTVEIVTDNSDLKLLPYLTANVRFIVAQKDGVLAVPNAALRWSPRDASAPAAGARTGQRGSSQPSGAGNPSNQAPASSGAPTATGDAGATGATGPSSPDNGAQRRRGAPGSGGAGNRGQGGERKARGEHSTGTVYVLENGQPKPITVRTGLTDGSVTEIQGEGLTDGTEVIVSEAVTQARGGAGGSPFTPQMFRGGGGGRGGR